MARYKPYDYGQMKLLPISFERQILPGSFEYTLSELIDEEVDLSGMSEGRRQLMKALFWIGEIGRGVAMGLIGFFLARAAVRYDASDATGLDGALRRLADSSWGPFVVALVGIGFVAYALYCLATFTRRRLHAP